MMKRTFRFGLILLSVLLPVSARPGAVLDADADLVPDQFDNCSHVANGPNQTTNQVDSDLDGYGNRCDADCNQDGATTVADFTCYFRCFGLSAAGACVGQDYDGNGTVTPSDFAVFLAKFSGVGPANAPGPTGLVCANLVHSPCTP